MISLIVNIVYFIYIFLKSLIIWNIKLVAIIFIALYQIVLKILKIIYKIAIFIALSLWKIFYKIFLCIKYFSILIIRILYLIIVFIFNCLIFLYQSLLFCYQVIIFIGQSIYIFIISSFVRLYRFIFYISSKPIPKVKLTLKLNIKVKKIKFVKFKLKFLPEKNFNLNIIDKLIVKIKYIQNKFVLYINMVRNNLNIVYYSILGNYKLFVIYIKNILKKIQTKGFIVISIQSLCRYLYKLFFSIIRFYYKFVISMISFFIYDVLQIKTFYRYLKKNIFISVSIFLIIFVNMYGVLFFYYNKNLFIEQNIKWQSRASFIPISSVILLLWDNILFKSIRYSNLEIEIFEGESMFKILEDNHIDSANAKLVMSKIAKYFNLKNIKKGWVINTVIVSYGNLPGKIQRMSLPISNQYDLIIESDSNNEYTAFKQQKKLTRYILRRRILIQDNFYKSANKVGVSDAVIEEVYKVLSWDVDFQREIREGDVLEVVYECLYNQLNELTSCDNLLYASLNGSQKSISLYKYNNTYYHSDGSSASKTLIKTPINGARLNSNYGFRNHPILGYVLLHKGIDFAARPGTPILASGDGVVEKMYYSNTYGNYIRIKHNQYLSSAYAHLQKFYSKLKQGDRVNQGDTIGYVGSTGRATGPHLHYEVLINRKQVNPSTMKMPSNQKLINEELDTFDKYKEVLDSTIIRIPTRGKIISPIYNPSDSLIEQETSKS